MGSASDYVYYIVVDGVINHDLIFSTRELAEEFAKESNYKNFEIIEWDVH